MRTAFHPSLSVGLFVFMKFEPGPISLRQFRFRAGHPELFEHLAKPIHGAERVLGRFLASFPGLAAPLKGPRIIFRNPSPFVVCEAGLGLGGAVIGPEADGLLVVPDRSVVLALFAVSAASDNENYSEILIVVTIRPNEPGTATDLDVWI